MYKTGGVSVKEKEKKFTKKKFDYDNDLFVLNHTRVAGYDLNSEGWESLP